MFSDFVPLDEISLASMLFCIFQNKMGEAKRRKEKGLPPRAIKKENKEGEEYEMKTEDNNNSI